MYILHGLLNRVIYHVFAYPVSLMPFWSHRALSAIVYFVLFRIIRYRRDVVRQNMQRSFPELDTDQLAIQEQRYFRYLSKLFVESVKNISISQDALLRRVKVRNPEILENIYARGQSVILAGTHYHNWEYMITAQNLLFSHQAVGIGSRMSSRYWNRKMTARRERFGMRVITKNNLHQKLSEWQDERIAILVLFDQSPPHTSRAYWTEFLSQQTGFLFGAEKLACTYNLPVVQYCMREVKSGFYEIELKLISEYPRSEEYGAITEKLVDNLEDQISEDPAFWLWTHKRWKLAPPDNAEALRSTQRDKHLKWQASLSVSS